LGFGSGVSWLHLHGGLGSSRGDAEAAVEQRQHQQGQGRGADQAADDDDGQRALDLGARAGGEEQRHEAEGGDAGGHQHRAQAAPAPSTITTCRWACPGVELVEVAHHHHAVEHRDAEQRDEADRGRHRQVFAGSRPAQTTPPTIAKGMLPGPAGLAHRAEGGEQQHEDQPEGDRHDDAEAGRGALLVLELAAPGDAVARGQFHLLAPTAARFASSTKPTRSRPRTLDWITE
jgi:hypothetical protein